MLAEYLKRERSGASVFEFTLTCPFMILLIFIIFSLMLILFSWASYGAVASTLAKDLNIRSTGLITANEKLSGTGDVLIQGESAGIPFQVKKSQFKVNESGTNSGLTGAYRNALMYSATEHADQLFFPYTRLDSINAYVKQLNNSDLESSKNLSNYIVKVDIKYDFAPIKILDLMNIPALKICATGYGIVT